MDRSPAHLPECQPHRKHHSQPSKATPRGLPVTMGHCHALGWLCFRICDLGCPPISNSAQRRWCSGSSMAKFFSWVLYKEAEVAPLHPSPAESLFPKDLSAGLNVPLHRWHSDHQPQHALSKVLPCPPWTQLDATLQSFVAKACVCFKIKTSKA